LSHLLDDRRKTAKDEYCLQTVPTVRLQELRIGHDLEASHFHQASADSIVAQVTDVLALQLLLAYPFVVYVPESNSFRSLELSGEQQTFPDLTSLVSLGPIT
jgi:hypothetical protein